MLRLRLFGPPSLTDASRPLAGAAQQRKPLAILALLAGAGDRGLTRDSLVGFLWPDLDEAHARGALKQALYALRESTGQDIVIGAGALRLNPDVCTSDLGDFRSALAQTRWEDAVTLQPRPFLEGFFVAKAWEFSEWVERERLALGESLRAAAARAVPICSSPAAPATVAVVEPPAPARSRRFRPALVTAGALCLVSYHGPGESAVQPEARPGDRPAPLVIRVSPIRFEADTMRVLIRLSNPGTTPVRLGSTILLLGTDSTSDKFLGYSLMGSERRTTELPDLAGGAGYDVVLKRTLGPREQTVHSASWLRCGREVYLQLRLLLFDERLRPSTVVLGLGVMNLEKNGVMLRARSFRYYAGEQRLEAEGKSYHSATGNREYLGELTRRVLDSSETGRGRYRSGKLRPLCG